MFVQYPLLYKEEWSVGMVGGKIFTALAVFLILSVFGMLVIYIVQIRGKLAQLMVDNLNLLNGMHEGLVVLSVPSDKQ